MSVRMYRLNPWLKDAHPAVVAAVALAYRRPGLAESGNYWGAPEAYRSDARMTARGLRQVEHVLREARAQLSRVTDADVLAVPDRCRLQVVRRSDGGWGAHYCAGQYWSTEYRYGVAELLCELARAWRDRQMREMARAQEVMFATAGAA